MKKGVFIFLLMTILIPSGIARKLVAEGNTYTIFARYKIEISDNPSVLNGKERKTYLLTYENANITVKIVADKTKGETKYLVVSDALSVQYSSHKNYFGVEKIDEKYSSEGLKTSGSALNRSEYFHQKVLTSWDVSELDKIKLIAAYYPSLLNNADYLVTSK
jgi:hypothetical protein